MASDWQGIDSNAVWNRQKGNLVEASRLMTEAISAAIQAGVSQERLSTMCNYLADIHMENDDYDAAEIAIRKAIAESESLQNIGLGDNLLLYADILSQKGNYDAASDAVKRAVDVFERNEHSHGVTRAKEKAKAIESQQAV
jgi:tetratricopeptide (TPR) repeat protein